MLQNQVKFLKLCKNPNKSVNVETKIETSNVNFKVGSINRYTPKSIYLHFSTYVDSSQLNNQYTWKKYTRKLYKVISELIKTLPIENDYIKSFLLSDLTKHTSTSWTKGDLTFIEYEVNLFIDVNKFQDFCYNLLEDEKKGLYSLFDDFIYCNLIDIIDDISSLINYHSEYNLNKSYIKQN
jgi:hypothetical protein